MEEKEELQEIPEKENDRAAMYRGFLYGVCVTCILVGIALFVRGELNKATKRNLNAENQVREEESELVLDNEKIQKKLSEMERIVNQYYLNDIDNEKVEASIYKGLIAGLDDPYAAYYTKEELKSMIEDNRGEYTGIGATLVQDQITGIVRVLRCSKGSPAEEGGLQEGDIIVSVNDMETKGVDLKEVVKRIKTEDGETVHLEVIREGEKGYLSFDLERREVEEETVFSEMMEDKIGYIQITGFSTVTTKQFQTALEELEEQGMERLIVDLRSNLGGVMHAVCDILDGLLPEGLIVYTEDKYGNRTEYRSDGGSAFDKPMVVLVNGYSASASEIFAGAVKDHEIATLVGTQTYGKGIVQRNVNMADGTAVKLTISKYYTPLGNDIHGKGITPDVEIKLSDDYDGYRETDNQLKKAIEVVKEIKD